MGRGPVEVDELPEAVVELPEDDAVELPLDEEDADADDAEAVVEEAAAELPCVDDVLLCSEEMKRMRAI